MKLSLTIFTKQKNTYYLYTLFQSVILNQNVIANVREICNIEMVNINSTKFLNRTNYNNTCSNSSQFSYKSILKFPKNI